MCPLAREIRKAPAIPASVGTAGMTTRGELRTVGQADLHVELWVPADELADFNAHLVGPIRVTRAFRGDPPEEINVHV